MRNMKAETRSGALFKLFYILLLLILCLALFFNQLQREKANQMFLNRRHDQAQALLTEDLPDEALMTLREGEMTVEDLALYYTAALESRRFALAEQLLSQNPSLQTEEDLRRLVKSLAEEDETAEAWRVMREWETLWKGENATEMAIALLQDVEEHAVSAVFVAGWFHDGVGVLRDEQGEYLVRSDGSSLNAAHYDEISANETGFLVRKGEAWMQFNASGTFQRVVEAQNASSESVVLDNAIVHVLPKEGGVGFFMGEEDLGLPTYERLSPVSPLGVAYGYAEGQWSQLRFNALREGGT